MPGDFKGQHIEKNGMWAFFIYWQRKNNLQILFFNSLEKKLALCVYGEYAKRRKKYRN
jgi:hypothetical protein